MTKDRSVTWGELLAALAALEGERVAVRIEGRTSGASQFAVFRGRLAAASQENDPYTFFAVKQDHDYADDYDVWQETGVYLREDEFEWASARSGADLLQIALTEAIIWVGRERLG